LKGGGIAIVDLMFSANWLIFKIWALFVSKDKNWIDKASILRQVHL
jgi:hypothetical protein